MVSRCAPRALRIRSRDAQALGSLRCASPSPNVSSASTRSAAPRRSACSAWTHGWTLTHTHAREARDQNLELPSFLFPIQRPGTRTKPISHCRKLEPTPGTLPTLLHPGLPMPTCSWTILCWASVQGPRPCSRSCSWRPSPNRQRCRLCCSASNASMPEPGC